MRPDARYVTRVEENTFYLTISNIKSADQGKIKAVLKNKVSQTETREALLTITGKKKLNYT